MQKMSFTDPLTSYEYFAFVSVEVLVERFHTGDKKQIMTLLKL